MTNETDYHILNFQKGYYKMHAGTIIIKGATSVITNVRCLKLDYQKCDRSAFGLIKTNNNSIFNITKLIFNFSKLFRARIN